MDITKCTIEVRRHALLRALERDITPEMVEATLKGGKIERFGKHYIRFSRPYKYFKVICIGEFVSDRIKIITIERGNQR